MPITLLFAGVLIGMAAINGTISDGPKGEPGLGTLVNKSLFGEAGKSEFLVWMLPIIVLAAIFKIVGLPGAGKMFPGLVIMAYFIVHPQTPNLIQQALKDAASIKAPAPSKAATSDSGGGAGGGGGGGTVGGGGEGVGGIAKDVVTQALGRPAHLRLSNKWAAPYLEVSSLENI
jgi:hypothetical protein